MQINPDPVAHQGQIGGPASDLTKSAMARPTSSSASSWIKCRALTVISRWFGHVRAKSRPREFDAKGAVGHRSQHSAELGLKKAGRRRLQRLGIFERLGGEMQASRVMFIRDGVQHSSVPGKDW